MQLKTAMPMGLASFAFALMVLAISVDWRLPGDQRGFQPAQPIAFSHATHAGDNKIDRSIRETLVLPIAQLGVAADTSGLRPSCR